MLPIIPAPQKITETGKVLTLPAVLSADPSVSVAPLIAAALRTHSVDFLSDGAPTVHFVSDPALPEEAYVLRATPEGVVIAASSAYGHQYGAATLCQIMERGADAHSFTVPECVIEDAPDCTWRGVLIDLARDFHPFHMLLEYVDTCWFYKIRTLHLHFTDDQSYTLPSRAFPRLSTEGRHYTEEEMATLIDYATARAVELMPEIDVPGHCKSFAEGYGDIFGRDGIICQSETSMACMEALFRELCGMFLTSPYIHIGGDEAEIKKWTECDKCLAAFRARGVDVDGILSKEDGKEELAQIMYATFVARMARAVLSCGKTPVIWEGFGASVNHLIPREAVIMSWENFYQVTPSLRDAGFRLVNCSWSPMYIVAPNVHWSVEEVYNWSVYTWHPVHPHSPYLKTGLVIPATPQVEGGQLLAWGDQIPNCPSIEEGQLAEQALIEERVPALAENVWHREKVSDFAEFSARYEKVTPLYARFKKKL